MKQTFKEFEQSIIQSIADAYDIPIEILTEYHESAIIIQLPGEIISTTINFSFYFDDKPTVKEDFPATALKLFNYNKVKL